MKLLKYPAILALMMGVCAATTTAQVVVTPCPEVRIDQRYDHIPYPKYQAQGWDTAVTCNHRQIELTAEPYIPVQWFNGTYLVEEITYNPVDPTFAMGTRMPITTDDDFSETATEIPYPFYFFGIRKSAFVLGANGLVTFNTDAAGHGCAWKYSAPIPWSSGTATGVPKNHDMTIDMIRDAIYGVYEDTHPLASYLSGTQGIYYGIQDDFPCRKIVCSWNGVPAFPGNSNLNNRSTYQIVCYEGSNIIEVHVKHRGVNTAWNGGAGLIGIQNATGTAQQKSTDPDQPNYYVVNGSPAAFYPDGKNTFNTILDSTAYRFTPQGTTNKNYEWYRIFDDGRDSVMLSTNPNDTNGYYIPMDPSSSTHPTLTRAIVSPNCVSKYVMHLKFKNANNDWYNLYDTITIGMDTANDLQIKLLGAADTAKVRDICQGQAAPVFLDYPESLEGERIQWQFSRILNGQIVPLPDTMCRLDESKRNLTIFPDPNVDSLPKNKIDTIYLQVSVDFISGCSNYDSAMIRIFPNFDTVDVEGICEGQTFTWEHNGQSYTQSTTSPHVTLHSQPGCDSVVHLNLTVYGVSYTVDHVMDCKPITWLNGVTYTESNQETSYMDTIVLQNRYGCDSIVSLDFTIHPMVPKIKSSLTEFTFDSLDVVLTDISTGHDSRRWEFPTGADQTGVNAYYSIPVELDEARITLITHSEYGCIDSAVLVLPFNKETFWVPNAFTPNLTTNNRFASVSKQTLSQEMYIYNRFGVLVFHCDGVDCEWDGTNMDGEPCPQGAYAYVIRYNNAYKPEKTHIIKGSVTLIR